MSAHTSNHATHRQSRRHGHMRTQEHTGTLTCTHTCIHCSTLMPVQSSTATRRPAVACRGSARLLWTPRHTHTHTFSAGLCHVGGRGRPRGHAFSLQCRRLCWVSGTQLPKDEDERCRSGLCVAVSPPQPQMQSCQTHANTHIDLCSLTQMHTVTQHTLEIHIGK